MKTKILIPEPLEHILREHLFSGAVEQGAFLFAHFEQREAVLALEAKEAYLIPPDAWTIQTEAHLELKNSERAKIMHFARKNALAAIECHSHPNSGEFVSFSPSDHRGIVEFSQYVKWKLDGRPYAATVWGESSIDAVVWYGDFARAHPVHQVCIEGIKGKTLTPRDTWSEAALYFLSGDEA